MDLDELKTITRGLTDIAVENLKRDKHLAPICVLMTKNGPIYLPVPADSVEMKDYLAWVVQSLIAEGTVTSCFFVMETWIVKGKKDQSVDSLYKESEGSLSKHPERQEAIFVSGDCPDGGMMAMCLFTRVGDEVCLDEIDTDYTTGAEGRFVFDWPKGSS